MIAITNVARATLWVAWLHVAVTSLMFGQSFDQLIPHRVKLDSVNYLGKRAVRITEDGNVPNGEAYAVVRAPGARHASSRWRRYGPNDRENPAFRFRPPGR